VERRKANDRLTPPLIKPDGQFSRIRLSKGPSRASLLRQGPFPRRPHGQPVEAPACLAVESALPLLDFRGCCDPVEERFRLRPAIARSLAVSARVDPSAPPSLPAGFTVRRVAPTTRDSDCSGGPRGLGGVAALDRGLRHGLAAGALPVYPDRPSCPVALADPAEIWCRRTTVGWRRMAAFAPPAGARLSVHLVEAHSMRFPVVPTGQFRLRRAFGFGLAASSQTQLSVVNRPIRPAGLAPAWPPASPAHAVSMQ
jgi:hypothetical protein